MAKFIFLCVGGDAVPDDKQESVNSAWMSYMGAIAATGKLSDGAPLSPNAKSVAADGTASDYDWYGPNAVGGYWIMECADIDEAVAHTKGCPQFLFGGKVDVIEIIPMSGM